MSIFIVFTLIINGVPLILCSDYIPKLTRNDRNQMQNVTNPIISQLSEDLTLNERMLKLEAKNQKQENEIHSLTATVKEDKKEISHLKGRIEQLESKYELNSSDDAFNGGKLKHRREVASSSSRPKENEKCARSSKSCTFFYPDNPDAIINTKNFFVKNVQKYFNNSNAEYQNLNRQPTNCKELNLLGHTLEGFYLVKGIDESGNNKVRTVYCTFMEENELRNFIGNVEMKTKNAHFYVQRNTNFGAEGIIPFEIERLNVGGAMNIKTGYFTAPVNGIYHFEFSSLKAADTFAPAYVELIANGITVGSSYVGEGSAHLPFTGLIASLRLKAGEKVWLKKAGKAPFMDLYYRFTHFTGWLVEESYAVLP